ncbi:hypothetical protein CFC21_024418, partial [Triticum aestivum]
KCNK